MMYKTQIVCIIIILFIAVFHFSYERTTTAARRFSVLLITSVVQLMFDICSVYTVNHLDIIPKLLNRAVHCAFMGLMLLVFVIGYRYLEAMIEYEKGEEIYRVKSIIAPFVLGVLGLMFLPISYIETQKGNYSHGPAVIMVYICISFCVALVIRLLIKYRMDIPAKKRKAVMIAMLSEAPVAAFQMIVPTSLVSCLAIVLFILGFYMTVENPDAKLVKLLEKETKRADAANQAKTNFLANMSHEIRTPINAVLGMNEMILRESRESVIREYARDVQGAAKSLLSIINDILDVTKIEAGKLKIVLVEYDFAGMIRDVVNMISFRAKAKGLEFEVDIDERIASTLLGDDIRIRQILVNLLNNAVKYTHEGSVRLKAELLHNASEDEALISFIVSDTGIGIKEEDMKKLFVPFERIEEKRNRTIEGTGLGMNITLQLLNLLDSRLEAKSEYGKGSVFSFELKQKIIDSRPIGSFDNHTQKADNEGDYYAAYEAPQARVLVVDDNEMNRKVFHSLLKDKKIQVEEAASGRDCLEKVVKTTYDIIFMDHMMPDMDGIETFKNMKEMQDYKCKNTPVVILTANAIAGAKEEYLREGFKAFLSKPIDIQKLDDLILQLLDRQLIHLVEKSALPEEQTDFLMADLPIVDGLDWEYAAMHFNNQNDMLEAVKLFYLSLDYEAQELERYYLQIDEEEGIKNYRIKVHSMKSSAGTIGIIPLSGMAKILEDAARNGECDTIHQLMPIFIEAWYEYKKRLNTFADTAEGMKAAEDFGEEIAEIFEEIRAAAADMDIDVLDDALEKLKEYHFEGEEQELFLKIQSAIVNLDVEFLEGI